MKVISDVDIIRLIEQQRFRIDPLEESLIRPASICLRLGSEYLVLETNGKPVDVKRKSTYPKYQPLSVSCSEGSIVIPPKEVVLVNTLERIALSSDIGGWITNLSGLARLGLQIALSHYVSPGYGDEGLTTLTLELFNFLDVPIHVYPGMRICHLLLFELSTEATTSYDRLVGTYSHQTGPRGSRFYTDFAD